jgi:hypothetical protein
MDCTQSVFSFDNRASTRWIDERPPTRRVHKTSIIVGVAIDFAQQRRFNLAYKDRANMDKAPICIHRAPLGTHERFIGFLIEHSTGNFRLWLAPEQVRILPIGDEPKVREYSMLILNELRAHQVRAEIDKSADNINGNIQRAEQMKVHTMFVIGKRDMEADAVSVRSTAKAISAPSRAPKSSPTSCGRSRPGVLRPKGTAYDFTHSSLHFTSKKVNSCVA